MKWLKNILKPGLEDELRKTIINVKGVYTYEVRKKGNPHKYRHLNGDFVEYMLITNLLRKCSLAALLCTGDAHHCALTAFIAVWT